MAPTHQQTHDAGRHLAVGEALARGDAAKIIGRSSLIEVNGHKAQVQVAGKGAWQVADVDQYTAATIEFIVLVDLTGGVREFYIVPGEQLRRDVRRRHDAYVASKGGTRPRTPGSKHTAIYADQVRKWRNAWKQLA